MSNELCESFRKLLKIDKHKSVIYISDIQNALNVVIEILQKHSSLPLKYAIQSSINHINDTNKIIYDIDQDGGINIDMISFSPSDIDCLIVSNFLGHVVDIEKYHIWANHHFKYLIIDNRLTPYSFYNRKNSCNYGNISIISFPHHSDGFIIIDNNIILDDDFSQYPYTDTILYETLLDINTQLNFEYFWKQIELYKLPVHKYPCYSDTNNNDTNNNDTNNNDTNNNGSETETDIIDVFNFKSYIVFFSEIPDSISRSFIQNNIAIEKYYKPTIPNRIDILFYNHIICLPCIGVDKNTIDLYIEILKDFRYLY
jgi:hypothetical protein